MLLWRGQFASAAVTLVYICVRAALNKREPPTDANSYQLCFVLNIYVPNRHA